MTGPSERLAAALADRYRIERELGAGGMATVYLAEDRRHHRQVAIKVLKPELAAVLGADRFVQEITTTAQLQHPHILPLFDSGTADGFLFYVMWQVSSGGGAAPRWSHDGRAIFYIDPARRMRMADVRTSPTFALVGQRLLGSQLSAAGAGGVAYAYFPTYAVTPDDRHFVMLAPPEHGSARSEFVPVVEIEHWRPGTPLNLGPRR